MTKKLLIIEDDKVLNEMYRLKFEKEGFEVKSAYDGLDGLSKIEEGFNPDIILLDLMMPSMNGFETLDTIKRQTSSDCKIIIFTNISDKDKINKAITMGADDYLIKANTTPKSAVEKINEILRKPLVIENSPIYIKPGLNIFKMKNPLNPDGKDIEISININI
ncbi:response regulator [Candidatus Gracilibacteria bacterium]|nr:response regulator [Candidatus Gracilibacteria bacterium]